MNERDLKDALRNIGHNYCARDSYFNHVSNPGSSLEPEMKRDGDKLVKVGQIDVQARINASRHVCDIKERLGSCFAPGASAPGMYVDTTAYPQTLAEAEKLLHRANDAKRGIYAQLDKAIRADLNLETFMSLDPDQVSQVLKNNDNLKKEVPVTPAE